MLHKIRECLGTWRADFYYLCSLMSYLSFFAGAGKMRESKGKSRKFWVFREPFNTVNQLVTLLFSCQRI